MWKIEHGGAGWLMNRVPAVFWNNATGMTFAVGTSLNENMFQYINVAPSYPNWFHLSVRV